MAILKIPITNEPYQDLTINSEGKDIQFRIRYNLITDIWSTDILVSDTNDEENGNTLSVFGIPITTGLDLVGNFNFNIGQIKAINFSNPDEDSTRENFGITYFLYLNDEADDETQITQGEAS